MKTTWQTFSIPDGRRVEAQVFEPLGDVRECILFCPGFPGLGATLFEQRHAATLVHEGYAVVVLRHAGIRLDGPTAPQMVNNAQRLMLARRKGEALIGGTPATMDTWLMEPYVALQTLAEKYAHIHVIGNSFGALSALWSLTEEGAALAPIKSILLQAGAQGIADNTPLSIMRIWLPQFIEMPRITEKVSLESGLAVSATLKYAYEQLPARVASRLPSSIPITYLVVQNDEILTLADTERFKAAIGGRGEIVIDSIDRAHPTHGLMAHDMPDYPTEYFLDILQARDAKGGLGSILAQKE